MKTVPEPAHSHSVTPQDNDNDEQTKLEGQIVDIGILTQSVTIKIASGKRITCKYDSGISDKDKTDIRKGVYLAFVGYRKGNRFFIRYTMTPKQFNADAPIELGQNALTIRELDRYLYEYGLTKDQLSDILDAVQVRSLSTWILRAKKYVKQYDLPFLQKRPSTKKKGK